MAGFEFLSAFRSPYAGRDFASNIDARIAAQRRVEQELYARELISAALPEMSAVADRYAMSMGIPEAQKEGYKLDQIPKAPLISAPVPAAPVASGGMSREPVQPITSPSGIDFSQQSREPVQLLGQITPSVAPGESVENAVSQKTGTATSTSTTAGAGTPQGNYVVNRSNELLTELPRRDFYAEKMAEQLGDLRQQAILDPSLNPAIVDPLLSTQIAGFSGQAQGAREVQNKFRELQLKEASDQVQAQKRAEAQRDVAEISAKARNSSDSIKLAVARIREGVDNKRTEALLYKIAGDIRLGGQKLVQDGMRTKAMIMSSQMGAMMFAAGGPYSQWANQFFDQVDGFGQDAQYTSSAMGSLAGYIGNGDTAGQAKMTDKANEGMASQFVQERAEQQSAMESAIAATQRVFGFAPGAPESEVKKAIDEANAKIDTVNSIKFPGSRTLPKMPLDTRYIVGGGSGGRAKSAASTTAPARPNLNTKGRTL